MSAFLLFVMQSVDIFRGIGSIHGSLTIRCKVATQSSLQLRVSDLGPQGFNFTARFLLFDAATL